jgi:hypothetical protein
MSRKNERKDQAAEESSAAEELPRGDRVPRTNAPRAEAGGPAGEEGGPEAGLTRRQKNNLRTIPEGSPNVPGRGE